MEVGSKSLAARTVTLNNGGKMPVIGLGTWRVPAGKARQAVLWALEAGYRMVDTSLNYWNERQVGAGVRESGIPREEVFVSTKLEHEDHGYENTFWGFEKSLRNLDIEYVDLYLIHWPRADLRHETWKAMEELLEGGRCRAIGVSNYTVRHLDELLEYARVVPAVNQVEIHPFLYPHDLVRFCAENGIQLQSYSPLTQGARLNHPVVTQVARKHERTPAQVVLRWHLQHDLVPLPRSASREHIEENLGAFEFSLDDDDMESLDSLNEELHLSWDPTEAP